MAAETARKEIDRSAADQESARRFGEWLRQHGLSLEEFSSRSGIGRTTVAALAGMSGPNPQTGWSGIRRGTLERIHRTANDVEPMTLRELGQALAVTMSDRPAVWSDVAAYAGRGEGAVTVQGLALMVTWDRLSEGPPHVCQGKSGSYQVLTKVPRGVVRLGRLVSITPV